MDVGYRIIMLDIVKSTSHLQHLENLIDSSNTTPMILWQFSNYFYRSFLVATIIFLELAKNGNVPGTNFIAFSHRNKI